MENYRVEIHVENVTSPKLRMIERVRYPDSSLTSISILSAAVANFTNGYSTIEQSMTEQELIQRLLDLLAKEHRQDIFYRVNLPPLPIRVGHSVDSSNFKAAIGRFPVFVIDLQHAGRRLHCAGGRRAQ